MSGPELGHGPLRVIVTWTLVFVILLLWIKEILACAHLLRLPAEVCASTIPASLPSAPSINHLYESFLYYLHALYSQHWITTHLFTLLQFVRSVKLVWIHLPPCQVCLSWQILHAIFSPYGSFHLEKSGYPTGWLEMFGRRGKNWIGTWQGLKTVSP